MINNFNFSDSVSKMNDTSATFAAGSTKNITIKRIYTKTTTKATPHICHSGYYLPFIL